MLNITEKILTGVIIFIAVILAPYALLKHIKNQAWKLTDYFSNNRVIFKQKRLPTKIKGLTVQCKNCNLLGENGYCGVMPSEKMDPESWCMTSSPEQFFSPKEKK